MRDSLSPAALQPLRAAPSESGVCSGRKLQFKQRGYNFTYPRDAGDLPDICTGKCQKGKKWIFETKELSALNDRVNESLTDIFQFTNAEVQGIYRVCREEVSGLYQAAEAVAMLDLLFSFATTVTLAGDKPYTRPRVQDSEQCTLAIKQARHPILDSIAADKVVPNDTYHNDQQNFSLITGPNMSGKSSESAAYSLPAHCAHADVDCVQRTSSRWRCAWCWRTSGRTCRRSSSPRRPSTASSLAHRRTTTWPTTSRAS